MTAPQEELLTIKEAAALLRVSEVSLRRWTDSGTLPCLRVGGRNERRFRAADVAAFAARSTNQSAAHSAEDSIALAGARVARGTHLCAFYESADGRDKLAIPFLREGLERGEHCCLVALPDVRDQWLARLEALLPGLGTLSGHRLLSFHAPDADPACTLAFFRASFASGTRDGRPLLRVLGDMAAFLEVGASLEALLDFEASFERGLAHKYPVVSLCQYDVSKFSGVAVLRALEVHSDLCNYPLRYFLGG
jgi:excisionase family DNA binding protein